MKRFFIDSPAVVGDTVRLKPDDCHHFVKVLRGRVGEQLEIVAVDAVFAAEVIRAEHEVEARLLTRLEDYSEAGIDVYVLQGIAKGERMDMVIQKAVELGAAAVVPVACERSVVQLTADKAAARIRRWQKIAEGAAKQCGRTRITEIMPVSTLTAALELLPDDAKIIMPWEEAEGRTLAAALSGEAPPAAAIIIGPEGGLTTAEVELAQAHGADVVTLGKRILRTETAAVAVLTILMYEWGDLG